ncbi:MAG: trypsin-like peptidase domain-containing protein [Gemmatimonadales bacterium]
MLVGIVIGVAAVPLFLDRDASRRDTALAAQIDFTQDLGPLGRFADVAEFATAAVVRIESEAAPSETAAPIQGRQDLPDFLEPFFGPGGGAPGGEPRPQIAGGSGFIVSADGRILTNAHVVLGGDLTVWLDDHRSFEAEVVGMDPTTDVAVLDIDAENLPVLPLGDSEKVRVGDWVMAIGSPGVGGGQLDQTVTAGIVSALGRPLQLLSQDLFADPETRDVAGYAIENFIQTDAVINPGNSGGPLLDMNGRVIGITSAIASTTGFYLGYGFAVPSNLVQGVMDDLVEFGEVRRGRLGVNVTTVTPEDAEYFGLDEVRGVLVQGAQEDSPAADAGIEQGDVLLSIDGAPLESAGDLQQEIAERSPGDEVTLEVRHDGETRRIQVELEEMDLDVAAAAAEPDDADAVRRLGMTLGPLTSEIRSELELGPDVDGAVVMEVSPMGAAYRRGIVPGTVVLEVAGEPVASPEEAADRLDDVASGDVTSLLVRGRDGSTRLLTIRVP